MREVVLRLRVDRDDDRAAVTLAGDDGARVAAWVQDAPPGGTQVELSRPHPGTMALVVVDEVITAVRLADGYAAATRRQEERRAASFPLGGPWVLEVDGPVIADGGHTGFHGGRLMVAWTGPEPRPRPAELDAQRARWLAGLAAAARRPVHRRLALRRDAEAVVVHEGSTSPAQGGEALLWPPITGPGGVLLRHAVVTDDGRDTHAAPQRPWLVRADGTVTQLPFELGVSPLLALPGDRWLLPGLDAVWRDDYDEPLGVLDATGGIAPFLLGGRPLPVSRILREAAPELLASLPSPDPHQDVPWQTLAAGLDRATGALQVAIGIDRVGEDPDLDATTLLVVRLHPAGAAPPTEIARLASTPRAEVVVAF